LYAHKQTNKQTIQNATILIFNIVGTVAMIAWCIWNNRNNYVWNGLKDTPKSIAMHAAHMMNEWRAVNTRQQQRRTPNIITAELQWQQPCSGWQKCNVDASFNDEIGRMSWGWCLRNFDGAFIAVGTNVSMHQLSTLEGEAMALLEVIREASIRGWSNIAFESDSQLVVDALQINHMGVSELNYIIMSIKSLLQCNSKFEIIFTKRQANMAAHTLIKAAIS
jgi:ribonuclease HI